MHAQAQLARVQPPHHSVVTVVGATSNTTQGTAAAGMPGQPQPAAQEGAAAAVGGSLGAEADPAAAAAAAQSRKRVLTDSQLSNLNKKPCTACRASIECAHLTCPECRAKQEPKKVVERRSLQEPIAPYAAGGALPKLQDSTQALANVSKRFEHAALLKQVRNTGAVKHPLLWELCHMAPAGVALSLLFVQNTGPKVTRVC